MKHNVVRLESIEIHNFKNVKYGSLNFENTRKPYSASILGLYGQNGSGKTALIDALSLLKHFSLSTHMFSSALLMASFLNHLLMRSMNKFQPMNL